MDFVLLDFARSLIGNLRFHFARNKISHTKTTHTIINKCQSKTPYNNYSGRKADMLEILNDTHVQLKKDEKHIRNHMRHLWAGDGGERRWWHYCLRWWGTSVTRWVGHNKSYIWRCCFEPVCRRITSYIIINCYICDPARSITSYKISTSNIIIVLGDKKEDTWSYFQDGEAVCRRSSH